MESNCAAQLVEEASNWKLLKAFQSRVLPLLQAAPDSTTQKDPRRTLHALDYSTAFLFAMLNPVFTSLNRLAEASHCVKMRQVTHKPFTAASFSDAQHWFDPALLETVVRSLVREVRAKGLESKTDPRLTQFLTQLTAVDGTLIRAVNRMTWTPSHAGMAVRLHLNYSVFEQIPEDWTITTGRVHETHPFKAKLQAGQFYVADRLYSQSHAILEHLLEKKADFVIRLNNNRILTPIGEDRPLTEEDKKAGVVWDRLVRLGITQKGPALRVVCIQAKGHLFHLVTSRLDLPAEIIGLIYRHRWEIETFFKWIKSLLNCRHWFAESPAGVTIQLYSVLIASLLLMLWTGSRPTQAMIHALQLYFSGFATEKELLFLLNRAARKKKK